MTMNAKKITQTNDRKRPDPLEAGTYPARVVQIISLGLQAQRAYKGEEKPPKIDIRMTYELSDEFLVDEDGNEDESKPRWVSETFSLNPLSSDLATSTKRYVAIDPELEHDGDFSKLVGRPCVVTLTKTPDKKDSDKFYNNVAGVSTMRAKEANKLEELKNDAVVFDFYEPNKEVFLSLPEWLQGIIKESLDFEGSDLQELLKASSSHKEVESETQEEEDTDDEDW